MKNLSKNQLAIALSYIIGMVNNANNTTSDFVSRDLKSKSDVVLTTLNLIGEIDFDTKKMLEKLVNNGNTELLEEYCKVNFGVVYGNNNK